MAFIQNDHVTDLLARQTMVDAMEDVSICTYGPKMPCLGCDLCYEGMVLASFYYVLKNGNIYRHSNNLPVVIRAYNEFRERNRTITHKEMVKFAAQAFV